MKAKIWKRRRRWLTKRQRDRITDLRRQRKHVIPCYVATPSPQKKTVKAYKAVSQQRKQDRANCFLCLSAQILPFRKMFGSMQLRDKQHPIQKTGRKKVKSKLGPLAYRPGWHSGDVPYASHIGVKDADGKIWARKTAKCGQRLKSLQT